MALVGTITSTSNLSPQSMKFNGEWLEMVIPRFRILSVSGRRMSTRSVNTTDYIGDGSQYRSKLYTSRTLTVTFYIEGSDETELTSAYDQLNMILNTDEPVEILFNDEPDKYYMGVFQQYSNGGSGYNWTETGTVGTLQFLCPDPYKYSTVEKEFKATKNSDGSYSCSIVNNGTVDVPISYNIKLNNDNGYIGIVSDNGIIQLGSTSEKSDTISIVNGTEELVNMDAIIAASDDTTNSFITYTPYQNTRFLNQGSFTSVEEPEDVEIKKYMVLNSKGTDTDNAWNGALKTITIDKDNACKNFIWYDIRRFEMGLYYQTGMFGISFLDNKDRLVCGMKCYKTNTSNMEAAVEFIVNGKIVETHVFNPTNEEENPYRSGHGHECIKKDGSTFTFYWDGNYPSFVDSTLKNTKIYKIQIYMAQYGTRNLSGNDEYITLNRIADASFSATNVNKIKDVVNSFTKGQTVAIDGETAKVYVSGLINNSLEVLGSTYFKAKPGTTKVKFLFSKFSKDNPPTFKASIREAWL